MHKEQNKNQFVKLDLFFFYYGQYSRIRHKFRIDGVKIYYQLSNQKYLYFKMQSIKPDDNDKFGISSKFLKKLIASDTKTYYYTSNLNDCLYLHYKGFEAITNLESYTALRVLHLEGNNIKQISGLTQLTQLRSLYLQQNLITEIKGLDSLASLARLNLSDNLIERVEGVTKLQKLEELYLKCNNIGGLGLSDLTSLLEIRQLSTLDLSDNKIADPNFKDQILAKLMKLSVLYLFNNPITLKILDYRKQLIFMIPTLKYLDTKPVFYEERRFAEAWKRGGAEQEKQQRMKYAKQKEQQMRKIHQDFRIAVQNYVIDNPNIDNIETSFEGDTSLQTYYTNSEIGQIDLQNLGSQNDHQFEVDTGFLAKLNDAKDE